MRPRPPTLLLFDIDGTLLLSGGAGARAIDRACRERLGLDDAFAGISPDGKTDPMLFNEVLIRNGLNLDPELVADLTARYIRHFPEEMAAAPGAHLLPGVVETLEAVNGLPDVALGLLTGNLEPTAWLKLEHFGLERFFTFGAFGSDDGQRERLVPIAVARAEKLLSRPVGCGPHVVVIGDTPRDVACALANQATAVGVASHRYPVGALRAAGAHHVLAHLADPQALPAMLDLPRAGRHRPTRQRYSGE
jgi:phosphoglycolate phosphatase